MTATEQTSRSDWDDLVGRLGGQAFQSWAWGELKSRFGWQPQRLSSVGGLSAAQLLIRPYRGLSVAYVPRGPITAADGSVDAGLLQEIVRTARSRRAAFVRLEPDLEQDDPKAAVLDAQLRAAGFRTAEKTIQPRSTVVLELAPTLPELLSGLSKGHRADLKRAERDGVIVRVATDLADTKTLHEMLNAVSTRKTFGYHSAAYYRVLLESFGDAARLLIAERDGVAIGASLVLEWAGQGTYLAAGSNADGLEHRAAHALQWHAISWAKERGARTWDHFGIADARGRVELAAAAGEDRGSPEMERLEADARRDPLDGVYRFKKGWGGHVVRFMPAYERVFIRPVHWLWQRRRSDA
ncbi:MAG TPA: peptidoglycan bridge formation glycyltransferase FemA/FemB family protein [Candidatus Limnocylindria bacterium]|nr:peptidoglycan bridge formation glycyltransferase FemA/FemB family protein [Candidatus Limnocylindria bacterium]